MCIFSRLCDTKNVVFSTKFSRGRATLQQGFDRSSHEFGANGWHVNLENHRIGGRPHRADSRTKISGPFGETPTQENKQRACRQYSKGFHATFIAIAEIFRHKTDGEKQRAACSQSPPGGSFIKSTRQIRRSPSIRHIRYG